MVRPSRQIQGDRVLRKDLFHRIKNVFQLCKLIDIIYQIVRSYISDLASIEVMGPTLHN
jgi:hypothetical protein